MVMVMLCHVWLVLNVEDFYMMKMAGRQ